MVGEGSLKYEKNYRERINVFDYIKTLHFYMTKDWRDKVKMHIVFEKNRKKKTSDKLHLNICSYLNLAINYIIFTIKCNGVGKELIKLLPFCMVIWPSVNLLLSVLLKPDKDRIVSYVVRQNCLY